VLRAKFFVGTCVVITVHGPIVSILDHVEQIASLDVGHPVEQDVIQDEYVDARELAQQLS